ncbi:fumarylacetoacetate hydrolase family protein [Paracoccus mutanolyticus]|uniref:fumarylacetoacetate hydrolase family protein n=1 Tax=Paracoccus mutanolyticus TaxID=1499308 RepID=UPI0021D5254E|nr:fumarylacetoacetate hydrolase family protein [Paracoccus mutanolyticus]
MPDRDIHHECELAVVIGKGGRGIPRERAMEHVFGYSCLLDMVVRGREERVMRKSFDSFCPLGPHIVTADSILLSIQPEHDGTQLWNATRTERPRRTSCPSEAGVLFVSRG